VIGLAPVSKPGSDALCSGVMGHLCLFFVVHLVIVVVVVVVVLLSSIYYKRKKLQFIYDVDDCS